MIARTVRLSTALLGEADAYARALGISFNALAAVALRDYLHARSKPMDAGGVAVSASHAPEGSAQPAKAPAPQSAPQHAPPARAGAGGVKVGRNDPCPCGSGQKFKRCCGGGVP